MPTKDEERSRIAADLFRLLPLTYQDLVLRFMAALCRIPESSISSALNSEESPGVGD